MTPKAQKHKINKQDFIKLKVSEQQKKQHFVVVEKTTTK